MYDVFAEFALLLLMTASPGFFHPCQRSLAGHRPVAVRADWPSNRDLQHGLRGHFTDEVAVVTREDFDGAALKRLGAPTFLYPMRNTVGYAVDALTAIIRNHESAS